MEIESLLWGSKAQRAGCLPLRRAGHARPWVLERAECMVACLIATGLIQLSGQWVATGLWNIHYNVFSCTGLKNNPASYRPCNSDLTGMW